MFFFNEKYTKNCLIYNLLKYSPEHISFHTPGHKRGRWDITELSFSDNLSCPQGVLKTVQEQIAEILGADASFLLTDGSTCGVLSMIRASKVKKLLFPKRSHKSVYNACALLGVQEVTFDLPQRQGIYAQPTAKEIEKLYIENGCDGVLLTSPDYYGNVADLGEIEKAVHFHGGVLLCDGAHGSHLHFTPLYAGRYCDIWVDGVHKNLPCYTQGAVVSCKKEFADSLAQSVDIFRTTSPNYMIMASVEYGVKYPRNERIERLAEKLKRKLHAYVNDDWSKIVLCYGDNAVSVQEYLEREGIYPEFCDGQYIMFYLSPATTASDLNKLEKILTELIPLQAEGKNEENVAGVSSKTTRWVELNDCAGKTCAKRVGLFPPCLPLLEDGELITPQKAERLLCATNVFGIKNNKILVYV